MSGAAAGVRRLFFALWPDDAVRDALRRATRTAVRHCGGRPVPPANYHLTLAFLGNVADERVAGLLAAARAVPPAVFSLTLERLGYYPAAQVLWLGPAQTPAALAGLAGRLRAVTDTAGVAPDPRPFQAHLTLARKLRSEPARSAVRPVTWPVSAFALVASDTDPAGARYRVLERFGRP